MAITIIAKIISAEVKTGVATIVIEFDDGKGKWQKTYINSQTEPIDFARFKDRIIADLRQDLKIKDQLANISAQVGKTFTITI
jgi:hypothetical protein